jgi:hypothetical protein
MTATCDRDLLGQLEILTGLTFLANNIFWPDVIGMQQRRQRISYLPSNHVVVVLLLGTTSNNYYYYYYSMHSTTTTTGVATTTAADAASSSPLLGG